MHEPSNPVRDFIVRHAAREEADRKSAERLKYEADMVASFRPHLERALAPYLEDARKTPSRSRHTQDVKRFKNFCDQLQMPWRPAAPEVICYFLLELRKTGLQALQP